ECSMGSHAPRASSRLRAPGTRAKARGSEGGVRPSTGSQIATSRPARERAAPSARPTKPAPAMTMSDLGTAVIWFYLAASLGPHPEEARSAVSKDGPRVRSPLHILRDAMLKHRSSG